MTADQYQLTKIALALGTSPAALAAAAPSLLELAAERFERRLAAIAARSTVPSAAAGPTRHSAIPTASGVSSAAAAAGL